MFLYLKLNEDVKFRPHSGAYGIGLIRHNCYKILSNYYLELKL